MGGVFDQNVVDRVIIDGADQSLGSGLGERAALEQGADDFLHLGIQFFRLDDFVDEADFAGAGGVDAFG